MIAILRTDLMKMTKLIFLVSVIVPCMILLMGWMFFKNGSMARIGETWENFLVQLNTLIVIFIPIAITVICCSLSNVEHKARAWKLLFSLPVKKSSIYFSKLFYVVFFTFMSFLILFGGIVLIGSSFLSEQSIPFTLILKQLFYPFLAFLSVIAFQLGFSLLVKNQAFPLIFGIFSAIFSYTFSVFPFNLEMILFWLYPSSASPLKLVSQNGEFIKVAYTSNSWVYSVLGLIVAILLAYISMKRLTKKDVY
ncbi:ABC transporter permease [Bacillus subtilis]|nr:ABC transporter permease [Bacillus subtilis]MDM5300292.1 ABC transporter permease [Bacillus subtilis]MDM5322345.1 ABC transporter permease [Bacillus subtilis]